MDCGSEAVRVALFVLLAALLFAWAVWEDSKDYLRKRKGNDCGNRLARRKDKEDGG